MPVSVSETLPGFRQYRIGMRRRVMITEKERPNMIAKASGAHSSEANVSGMMPITVVSVVRTIGRKRETDASTTICRMSASPRSCASGSSRR